MSRRDKIVALLDSPFDGEREAARAALERTTATEPFIKPAPAYGTKEWREAIQEWCHKIEFCLQRLGSPLLSTSEVTVIRNLSKNRGDPWNFMAAREFLPIYIKLKQADA